jgi:hypothetical protein
VLKTSIYNKPQSGGAATLGCEAAHNAPHTQRFAAVQLMLCMMFWQSENLFSAGRLEFAEVA